MPEVLTLEINMKLVKSLLLGSAAGLCAAAGAQAADLPMRKAAPVVEYVRVCTAYGAGFFYIPGTDTCLRVGGRARFEYQYTSQRNNRNTADSGYRGLGRVNLDARTQTSYGTLRAFVRLEIASRTGGYLKSGTQERYANAFFGSGVDTQSQAQKYVDIDKAFIQFAGFTAGRSASFFDFYAHDLELVGSSLGSDVSATNLLAYTMTFGNGFSGTLAMEDPTFRRNPIFFNALAASAGTAGAVPATVPGLSGTVINTQGVTPVAFVATGFNAAGVPVTANALNTVQQNNLPDFVGVFRYDAPWGAAQLSGAVHEVKVGNINNSFGTFAVNGGGAVVSGQASKIPAAEYGWAVQGGLKVNMPMISPGDVLWLQAAYAEGAGSYTGAWLPPGQEILTNTYTNRFSVTQADAAVDAFNRLHLTTTYSGTIGFLHYWTPEVRQGVFASYASIEYDKILRTGQGVVGGTTTVRSSFDPTLKSYGSVYVGSNLIWSPVKDLDIGVEAVYQKLDIRGSVFDANKSTLAACTGGTSFCRVAKTDDQVLVRMRVQRDF